MAAFLRGNGVIHRTRPGGKLFKWMTTATVTSGVLVKFEKFSKTFRMKMGSCKQFFFSYNDRLERWAPKGGERTL